MTIGENIRRKRLEYDIEQQELAKRIGVTAGLISRIERENLESVHMGCGSPLEDDDTYFIAMAHERDPETLNCYLLYIYDREEDKLYCYSEHLTYADALIRTGEYINL